MENTSQIRNTYHRLGMAMLVFLVSCQILPTIPLILIQEFWPELSRNNWVQMLVLDGSQYLLGLPLFLLIFRTIQSEPPVLEKHKLSLGKMCSYIVLSWGMAYMFSTVGNLINHMFAAFKGSNVTNVVEQGLSGYNTLQIFIMMVILAPILEEFIFRRCVYRCVGQYGEKTYILTSSFLFMLVHANVVQYPYSFVIGILLAWVYLRSGSLIYPILIHASVNFVGGVLATQAMSNGALLLLLAFIYLCGLAWLLVKVLRSSSRIRLHNEKPLTRDEVDALLLNPGMMLFTLASLLLAGYVILM